MSKADLFETRNEIFLLLCIEIKIIKALIIGNFYLPSERANLLTVSENPVSS